MIAEPLDFPGTEVGGVRTGQGLAWQLPDLLPGLFALDRVEELALNLCGKPLSWHVHRDQPGHGVFATNSYNAGREQHKEAWTASHLVGLCSLLECLVVSSHLLPPGT